MRLDDLEDRARAVLDPAGFDYIAGGAEAEVTLRDNVAAWGRYRIRPRVLRDVSRVDLSTTVLGARLAAPLLVAPTAYHRISDPEGEPATLRGTHAAGVGFVASTMATVSLEETAAAAPASVRWFQLYVHADRELTLSLVRRAEAAGYRALVLTVDTPRLGIRRRHGDTGYVMPPHLHLANLVQPGGPALEANISGYAEVAFDPSLTMDAISWLRAHTTLPVVAKGVLRGDDARACVDSGAAAVVVSNHGGRQLDGVVATADALAEVVAAVAGQAEVYVDGGIRCGTDVLRALALGARAVLLGRLPIYGLALGGADGVREVLDTIAGELRNACALAGVPTCADAKPDLLA